jgi:hypothetical protein
MRAIHWRCLIYLTVAFAILMVGYARIEKWGVDRVTELKRTRYETSLNSVQSRVPQRSRPRGCVRAERQARPSRLVSCASASQAGAFLMAARDD